jgi:chromate transport protein ChrA
MLLRQKTTFIGVILFLYVCILLSAVAVRHPVLIILAALVVIDIVVTIVFKNPAGPRLAQDTKKDVPGAAIDIEVEESND